MSQSIFIGYVDFSAFYGWIKHSDSFGLNEVSDF